MAEVSPGADRRPLTQYNYISYGAPAAPLALAGLPLAVYLPVIYADSDGFGLSLATVASPHPARPVGALENAAHSQMQPQFGDAARSTGC